MPKRDLLEGYLFNGVRYGPGKQVEVPDDEDFSARVDELEDVAKRKGELAAEGLELLPSGHPYRTLLASVSNQPEGSASETPTAPSETGPVPLEYRPDGFSVSGTGAPDPENYMPGQQRAGTSATGLEQSDEEPAKPKQQAQPTEKKPESAPAATTTAQKSA